MKVSLKPLLVCCLVATLGLVSGCAREADPNAPTSKIGTSVDTVDHSDETYYWISMSSTLPMFRENDYVGWERAAAELGVQGKMVGPTGTDLQAFVATIDQICASKPAGVSVVGWDPSVGASIDNCIKQGVPVVTDDADVSNSNRISFIGSNWYNIGVTAAEELMKVTPPGPVATVSIAYSDIMKQAVQGFEDTLEDTDYKVVANVNDEANIETATTNTASLLAAHRDLVGIAAFDAQAGPGAVTAVTEAGKAGKVKIVSLDVSTDFLKNIKSGTVSTVIKQKRELFTYYALKTLYDYNHNGLTMGGISKEEVPPVPTNIETGMLVITKDNVDQLLAAKK